MRTLVLLGLGAFSIMAATPVLARDAMASRDQSKPSGVMMSAADMRMAKACNAMPHEAMMNKISCTRVMKAHADIMKQDDMMKPGH
jgi:hypothetical protein